ncbi:energy transducer TonB [Acinetobacter sp. R933-2]|nr:energy transducer TonB [Acinetobacter sp. R933-2]
MMNIVGSKRGLYDHGIALAITFAMHMGILFWLTTVEMTKTFIEPQPKTIQLKFVKIPSPVEDKTELLPSSPSKVKEPTRETPTATASKPIQAKERQVQTQQQTQSPSNSKKLNSEQAKDPLVETQQKVALTTQKTQMTDNTVLETAKSYSEKITQSITSSETVSKQVENKKESEAIPQAPPVKDNFDVKNYQPIDKIAPSYPEQALDRKLEGDCTVIYNVTDKGRVENPKAQDDCHPMFIRPSIQAALNFKYQPRLVDGKPTRVQNVKNTFQYRISS